MSTPSSSDVFLALCADVAACRACPNVRFNHILSPSNGTLQARALFVAEAPGRLGAAVTGVPLSGDEAGRRFEAFLAAAGTCRDEVFVTNAVLCQPATLYGLNRTPDRGEVAECGVFLARTLDLVDAPVVVALGRVALDALALIEPHGLTLADGVSRPITWRERVLVTLYHPARRSTVHRSHEQQLEDWRALGQTLTAVTAHPS